VSWLTFVEQLVHDILSWPVAFILAVLVLRSALAGAISDIAEWSGFGQTIKFARQIAQSERQVEAATTAVAQGLPESLTPEASVEASPETAELAETNASYVVISSWESLWRSVLDLAGYLDLLSPRGRRATQSAVLQALKSSAHVPDQFVAAIEELRGIRNEVAHGDRAPSPGQALSYVEQASQIEALTRALIRRMQPGV
jgi:hypothetical protein